MPLHYRGNNPVNQRLPQVFDDDFFYFALHVVVFFLIIVLLVGFDQGKYQSENVFPFDERVWIKRALTVTLVVYILLLYTEYKFRTRHSTYAMIIGKWSLLSGYLATVLLVLMHNQFLGWMFFAIWFIGFVKAILNLCKNLCRLTHDAVVKALFLLRRLVGRELTVEPDQLPI